MKRTFVYVVASTAAVFLIPIFFHRSNCKCAKFEIASISFACTIHMHIYFFKSDEQNEMVMNEFIFTYGVVQVCVPRSTMANVWHWERDNKKKHIHISQTQIIPFPYLFLSKQCAAMAPTPFCNIYVCFHTIPHFI